MAYNYRPFADVDKTTDTCGVDNAIVLDDHIVTDVDWEEGDSKRTET